VTEIGGEIWTVPLPSMFATNKAPSGGPLNLWPVITDVGLESDQAVPAREGGGRVGRKREGRQGREDQGRKDTARRLVRFTESSSPVSRGSCRWTLEQGHAPIALERRP
jgi:hypothetical protein